MCIIDMPKSDAPGFNNYLMSSIELFQKCLPIFAKKHKDVPSYCKFFRVDRSSLLHLRLLASQYAQYRFEWMEISSAKCIRWNFFGGKCPIQP